jgi:hypothetical protein
MLVSQQAQQAQQARMKIRGYGLTTMVLPLLQNTAQITINGSLVMMVI